MVPDGSSLMALLNDDPFPFHVCAKEPSEVPFHVCAKEPSVGALESSGIPFHVCAKEPSGFSFMCVPRSPQ